jgi:hypothetical protein
LLAEPRAGDRRGRLLGQQRAEGREGIVGRSGDIDRGVEQRLSRGQVASIHRRPAEIARDWQEQASLGAQRDCVAAHLRQPRAERIGQRLIALRARKRLDRAQIGAHQLRAIVDAPALEAQCGQRHQGNK